MNHPGPSSHHRWRCDRLQRGLSPGAHGLDRRGLLERNRLTSGTTWHSAGLIVTFGSPSETSIEMRKYTRDLYSRLESETGLATGFMPVGFIELVDPHVHVNQWVDASQN